MLVRKETRERNGTTYYLRYCNDWLDFISLAEQVEQGRRGETYGGMSCESVEDDRPDWYGTRTLAEAISLARTGWPEGREKVRQVYERLNIRNLLPHSLRVKARRDVSGDEPDIDLYLQGEPENMITLYEDHVEQRGKVIRFIINRSVPCHVDSDTVVLRGTALMAVFEAVIHLGYSADVTICFSELASGYGEAMTERYVPILHAGDPINLDTMAFMFIHPAVLRRLKFAAEECETTEIRKQFGYHQCGGYGYPKDPVFTSEYDLLLKWEEGLFENEKDILPFVYDILRRVNIVPRS